MNDEELRDAWRAFDPTARRRRRIDARVFGWLDARDTPLAIEWLDLFRLAPFEALGLVAASTLAIVATPLAWLAGALI